MPEFRWRDAERLQEKEKKKGEMKELGHISSISIVPVINTLATSTSVKAQMNERGTIH